MAMAMASTSRESRRKRIVERGSDRLAFITGQIRQLPSDRSTTSLPSSQCPGDDYSPAGLSIREKKLNENAEEIVCESSTRLPSSEMRQELSEAPPVSCDKIKTPTVPSTSQTSSVSHSNAGKPLEAVGHILHKAFSLDKVTEAIAASNYMRLLCCITLALLVLSSFTEFPLKTNLRLRPVFFLLLTNITLVLGNLLINNRGDSAKNKEDGSGGADLFSQLGNALEVFLMMQKVTDAFLMDFSIYAVIVVCGLSCALKFG